MIYPLHHRAARRILLWIPLFVAFLLCLAAGAAFAAAIGDQVELKATHQAGVPLSPRTTGYEYLPAYP